MYLELAAVDAFHKELGIVDDADWNDMPIEEGLMENLGTMLIDLSKQLEASVKAGCIHALRCHLLLEELGEYMLAKNEVDALDGLTDLLYVLLGTATTYDWPLAEAFAEIHRSNMTKHQQADDLLKMRIRDKGPEYVPPQIEFVLKTHRADSSQTKMNSVRSELKNIHDVFLEKDKSE